MMKPDHELLADENRRLRLLRISADLAVQTLMTTPMSQSDAEKIIEGTRNLAATLFPGKDHVFDLIYLPRFRRALRESGLLGRCRPRLVPEPRSDQERGDPQSGDHDNTTYDV